MFRFGTYGICATGVMSSSSERPKIPTTITTTPELHRIVKSVPEARTRKQLADKRNKLKTADRQLAELQDELDALTEKRDNAQSDYHELTSKHQEQLRTKLTDAVFARMVVDIRSLLDAMPSELKADIDGDFLTAIAEQPIEILKCAMYLFLGYLDGATQYVSFASRNLAKVGRRPVRGRRSRKLPTAIRPVMRRRKW